MNNFDYFPVLVTSAAGGQNTPFHLNPELTLLLKKKKPKPFKAGYIRFGITFLIHLQPLVVDWGLHPSDLFGPSYGEDVLEAWKERNSTVIQLFNQKYKNMSLNVSSEKVWTSENIEFHLKSCKKTPISFSLVLCDVRSPMLLQSLTKHLGCSVHRNYTP